jgi:ABC-2 type transport system ATP-binding protein
MTAASHGVAIAVHDVSYVYPNGRRALSNVNFEVRSSEIFTVLGRNGAGKSTLFSLLAAFRNPTRGKIEVVAAKASGHRLTSDVGVVLQSPGLDTMMSTREHVKLQLTLSGISGVTRAKRIDEVLELTGLRHVARQRVGELSGGMRRRLDIGLAMSGSPSILILDEPTTGLDPQNRRAIWDTVRFMSEHAQCTTVFSTQYIEEAEELDGTILVLKEGEVSFIGSHSELRRLGGHDVVEVRLSDTVTATKVEQRLDELTSVEEVVVDDHKLKILTDSAEVAIADSAVKLTELGVGISSIASTTPGLEDGLNSLVDDE